jgi:hypothetical protein
VSTVKACQVCLKITSQAYAGGNVCVYEMFL